MKLFFRLALFALVFVSFFAVQASSNQLGLQFKDRTVYLHMGLQDDLFVEKESVFPALEKPFADMFLRASDTQKPYIFVDREAFLSFLTQASLRDSVDQYSEVSVAYTNGDWVFDGRPYEAYLLDDDALIRRVHTALNTGKPLVSVPYKRSFSRPDVAHDVQKNYNIHEVLAIGESNFSGSTQTRIQNIKRAAEQFNGVLIPRGRTFSFNDLVGDITEANGYTSENVIKGNSTVKEVGGGVCEVSTAAFRAAFFSGLPILERSNHSLALQHYLPVGLDSAIYLGIKNLRFRNDSVGDVLIQTYTDDENVYFVFYGEKDGRRTSFEGPFVTNVREPRPYLITDDVEPQTGYNTRWVRRIEEEGVVRAETFDSNYRPWVMAKKKEDVLVTLKD